ncbi:hypothetical protein, partial [Pseudomonas mediterranea]|uniref:hypothetical protein n=1 Tax=Pseudomonas mediterranea TaxID=183795 RepID=UPI001F3ABA3C
KLSISLIGRAIETPLFPAHSDGASSHPIAHADKTAPAPYRIFVSGMCTSSARISRRRVRHCRQKT